MERGLFLRFFNFCRKTLDKSLLCENYLRKNKKWSHCDHFLFHIGFDLIGNQTAFNYFTVER